MDFAWVVDALRRGLKVTREAWKGDPPMYLYMCKTCNGRGIMMCTGTKKDFDWYPTADQMLTVTDWEEYVEPKKAAPDKSTQEDLPVWPEVNADGYARMSKDSDAVVHDGVYRPPKKKPMFGNTKLTLDENGPHMGDTPMLQFIRETTGSSGLGGGKPVEDVPDEEHQKQLLDTLVKAFAELVSQRVAQLLQKTDVPLSKEDTNHV